MPLSRRAVTALLIAGLVLPSSASVAQDASSGWASSEDDLAFATNDTLDSVPAWSTVMPEEFPRLLSGLPGPEFLYRVDGALETGTRVARLLDGGALTWLEEGRTPVIATAVVDDGNGAVWARQQHIVSFPGGCPAGADDCIPADLVSDLVSLAQPDGTPVGPLDVGQPFGSGSVASTSVIDGDGTLFSFGGDSSVGTSVRVRDDDTIAVRGTADIGTGLGGRLRGFDALVFDAEATEPWNDLPDLRSRAREIRDAGADPGEVNRRVFDCPPSRRGVALGQYLINGLGRNVGPDVDPALEGGIAALVTDVVFFDCGPDPAGSGPDDAVLTDKDSDDVVGGTGPGSDVLVGSDDDVPIGDGDDVLIGGGDGDDTLLGDPSDGGGILADDPVNDTLGDPDNLLGDSGDLLGGPDDPLGGPDDLVGDPDDLLGEASDPGRGGGIFQEDPRVSLLCASIRADHERFRTRRGGATQVTPSSLIERLIFLTTGVAPDGSVTVRQQIGTANGGELFSFELEGTELDQERYPGATLWRGRSQVGITEYGPKPFEGLEISTGDSTFDVLGPLTDLLGEAHVVRSGERRDSGCVEGFAFGDLVDAPEKVEFAIDELVFIDDLE